MRRVVIGIGLAALLTSACASSEARSKGSEEVLRLGIFPNLTHAPGLVAVASGILEETLAPTKVDLKVFNSGSDAGNALLGGSLDASYIGPTPTASLYLRSKKIAVISGAVGGGASFVVRPDAGITNPADLRGKKIAVPGIGNTQDIALRTWLHENGLEAKDEGGDVAIVAVDNPELPQVFRAKDVAGAWEPEPWPSVLTEAGLAEVFVDEADEWPGGEFLTTNLIATTGYADAHPAIVRKLVEANVRALQLIEDDPEEAKRLANQQLAEVGAAQIDPAVLDRAWARLQFTADPLAESLRANAERAFELGVIEDDPASILDVYRLDDLEAVLEELGLPGIEAPA